MFGEFHRQDEKVTAEQANWQGWTPPWLSPDEGQQRGPFGPGRGFGPGGHRGPFGPRHGHGWKGFRGPFGPGFGPGPGRHWNIPEEILALRSEAGEVARLFAIASRGAFENRERVSQLHSLLERTRKELTDMIYSSAKGQTPKAGEGTQNSTDVGQA